MNKQQLRELVEETLIDIGYDSGSAVELILGTIAVESYNGYYIKQVRGPALGIGQMEPDTFHWLLENYLSWNPDLLDHIKRVCNIGDFNKETLVYNLKFAICMTRVRYLVDPHPLPEPGNLDALAGYWKRVYNSYLGAGTTKKFKTLYKKHVV